MNLTDSEATIEALKSAPLWCAVPETCAVNDQKVKIAESHKPLTVAVTGPGLYFLIRCSRKVLSEWILAFRLLNMIKISFLVEFKIFFGVQHCTIEMLFILGPDLTINIPLIWVSTLRMPFHPEGLPKYNNTVQQEKEECFTEFYYNILPLESIFHLEKAS